MKYHYLNEPISYSAVAELDDIASYDFKWKFDDGEVLEGPYVSKTWHRLGDHLIELLITDKESGYFKKETLNVAILLRSGVNTDVKHSIVSKLSVTISSKFQKILSNIRPTDTYVNVFSKFKVDL